MLFQSMDIYFLRGLLFVLQRMHRFFYCVQLSYIVPIVALVIYFGQLYYHEAII